MTIMDKKPIRPFRVQSNWEPRHTDDDVDMDVTFEIAAKCVKDGGDGWQESLLGAKRDESFGAGRKNGIHQRPLLEEQFPELGWDGEGDVEISAVWKHLIHPGNPAIHLDLGTHRAETTLAGSRDLAGLIGMIRASKGGKAEAIRLSAVHDLPDIVGHDPGDQLRITSKVSPPVIPEDSLQREWAITNCFHGLGIYQKAIKLEVLSIADGGRVQECRANHHDFAFDFDFLPRRGIMFCIVSTLK